MRLLFTVSMCARELRSICNMAWKITALEGHSQTEVAHLNLGLSFHGHGKQKKQLRLEQGVRSMAVQEPHPSMIHPGNVGVVLASQHDFDQRVGDCFGLLLPLIVKALTWQSAILSTEHVWASCANLPGTEEDAVLKEHCAVLYVPPASCSRRTEVARTAQSSESSTQGFGSVVMCINRVACSASFVDPYMKQSVWYDLCALDFVAKLFPGQ